LNSVCDVVDGEMGACKRGTADFTSVANRIAGVFSIGGAHKGSPLADAARGVGACADTVQFLVGVAKTFGSYVNAESDAARWLQTSPERLVEQYTNSPARPVFLIGGARQLPGFVDFAAHCLSTGGNDGIVAYSSEFACKGDPATPYDDRSLCSRGEKQKPKNFLNLVAIFENHDTEHVSYSEPVALTRTVVNDGIVVSGEGAGRGSAALLIDQLLKGSLLEPFLR